MDADRCGQTKYLFFYVGDSLYAVEAFKTFGVCEITSLTPLVRSLPYVIGMTSLDHHIWPVVDLRMRLYGKKANRNGRGNFLTVAIDDKGHKFLAVIDSVVNTADICADMIIPVNPQADFIRAFINTGDVTARLLALEELFDT